MIIELEVNAMKKIGLIIADLSLSMLLLGTGVWADITLTQSADKYPDLVFETSPNVDMDYDGNGTGVNTIGYFITSVNTKGTIEYGIVNDYSGYYQHENVHANNATTAAGGTIRGWVSSGAQ